MYSAALVVAVMLALSNMPTPLYIHWQGEMGFSSSVLTTLFSVYIIGLLISLAVSGGLVARFGSRRVLLFGLFMAITACSLFILARAEWPLLLARLLSGGAVGTAITAGIPWLIDLGGADKRHVALPLASGAIAAGAGFGPILSGASTLATGHPVEATFACQFVLLCGVSSLVLTSPSHLRGLPARGARFGLLPRVVGAELACLVRGIASFGCALGATAFVLSLGPSVLHDLTGVRGGLVAGSMAGAMFLFGALSQFLGSRLSPKTMFVAAGAAIVLACIAIAASALMRLTAPLLAGAVLAGVGYGLAQLAGLTHIADRVAPERITEANALLNIGAYVPCGLLPIATGIAVDCIGLGDGTLTFASVVGLATLATTVLVARSVARSAG